MAASSCCCCHAARCVCQVTDFVDGGISGYNNPENAIISALTMSRYNISYPAGPDR